MDRLPFNLESLQKKTCEVIPGVFVQTYGSMTVEELIRFSEMYENGGLSQKDQLVKMCDFVAYIMCKRTGDSDWTVEAVMQLPQSFINDIVTFFANGEKIVGEATGTEEGNALLTGAVSIGGLDSITPQSSDSIESNSGIAL